MGRKCAAGQVGFSPREPRNRNATSVSVEIRVQILICKKKTRESVTKPPKKTVELPKKIVFWALSLVGRGIIVCWVGPQGLSRSAIACVGSAGEREEPYSCNI